MTQKLTQTTTRAAATVASSDDIPMSRLRCRIPGISPDISIT